MVSRKLEQWDFFLNTRGNGCLGAGRPIQTHWTVRIRSDATPEPVNTGNIYSRWNDWVHTRCCLLLEKHPNEPHTVLYLTNAALSFRNFNRETFTSNIYKASDFLSKALQHLVHLSANLVSNLNDIKQQQQQKKFAHVQNYVKASYLLQMTSLFIQDPARESQDLSAWTAWGSVKRNMQKFVMKSLIWGHIVNKRNQKTSSHAGHLMTVCARQKKSDVK